MSFLKQSETLYPNYATTFATNKWPFRNRNMQSGDMRASKCTLQLQRQLSETVFKYLNKNTHQKAPRANKFHCLQFHVAKICHTLLYHKLRIRSDVSFRHQLAMTCGRYALSNVLNCHTFRIWTGNCRHLLKVCTFYNVLFKFCKFETWNAFLFQYLNTGLCAWFESVF